MEEELNKLCQGEEMMMIIIKLVVNRVGGVSVNKQRNTRKLRTQWTMGTFNNIVAELPTMRCVALVGVIIIN